MVWEDVKKRQKIIDNFLEQFYFAHMTFACSCHSTGMCLYKRYIMGLVHDQEIYRLAIEYENNKYKTA